MKNQIKMFFLLALILTNAQVHCGVIPANLQSIILNISKEIRMASFSQHRIETNQNELFKNMLLLHVKPVHNYIITQAGDLIPCFYEFYKELIRQIQNSYAIENSNNILHLCIAQNQLISTLDNTIEQNLHCPEIVDVIQHIVNIQTIIYTQNNLLLQKTTQAYSAMDSATESCVKQSSIFRIQELLDEHKLTASELAKKVYLSLSYICKLKNGSSHCSITTLQKIAAVFCINEKDLFKNPDDIKSFTKSRLIGLEEEISSGGHIKFISTRPNKAFFSQQSAVAATAASSNMGSSNKFNSRPLTFFSKHSNTVSNNEPSCKRPKKN